MSAQPHRSDTTASSSLGGARSRASQSTTKPRRDLHWFVQRTIVATCGLLIGILIARVFGF